MREYSTELLIGFLVTLFFLFVLVLIDNDHRNTKLVAELVKSGTSPMEARCAIYGDSSRNGECLVLTLKEKQ